MIPSQREGRFVFRFRLQTVLVLLTAMTLPLGLVCSELHREHRKKQDAERIRHLVGMYILFMTFGRNPNRRA